MTEKQPRRLTPARHTAEGLRELEAIIEDERTVSRATGVAAYIDAGRALSEIRDGEIYRVRRHRTFATYLRARWRMSVEDAEWIIAVSDTSQRLISVARSAHAADTAAAPMRIVNRDKDES